MELNCNFGIYFNKYTCDIAQASITQPSTEIKAVHGVHQPGRNNADVKVLWIHGNVVNFIPRGLDIFFPNLIQLHIQNCGLKQISREELVGFEKLEVLNLCGNKLTSLPDDLFINMPKLKQIHFNNNIIEFMSSNLLKPVMNNKLIYVDFRGNTKIDSIFYPGLAESVKSIEDLMQIIDNQCLKPADPETFKCDFKSELTQQELFMTHQTNASKYFSNLWSTGKLSDFVINVNGSKQFRVHKNILEAQSAGFVEMFENDENATEMKIEDLSAEAVDEFLQYFYTGKLTIDTKHAMEIFALASKLKVPEIQKLTANMILSELKETNALKIFTLGHKYESDEIKRSAFEEIRKMFSDRKLPDNLIDNLEAVKEIVEAKEKIDAVVSKVSG